MKTVKTVIDEQKINETRKSLDPIIDVLKGLSENISKQSCLSDDEKQIIAESLGKCIDNVSEIKTGILSEKEEQVDNYKSGMIRLYKEDGRWHLSKESRNGNTLIGKMFDLTRNDIVNIKNCCEDALSGTVKEG